MFADMARIQKESYCKKKKSFPQKKSYFYFRQHEFMKAAIINRTAVACICSNNFLTKMLFYFLLQPFAIFFSWTNLQKPIDEEAKTILKPKSF